MYQGFKTVQGKSEMLPLYQDKKKPENPPQSERDLSL